MNDKALYDPKQGVMRVAGFMSGLGSVLERAIMHERTLEAAGETPYRVALIFYERAECTRAAEIGARYNIPVRFLDIKSFHQQRKKPLHDIETRRAFDTEVASLLAEHDIHTIALAGYRSLVTHELTSRYLIVNVHPADLRIKASDGQPRYRGLHAVRDAIAAGERELRSTVHLVEDERLDCGQILMVSEAVPVPENSKPRDTKMPNITFPADLIGMYWDKVKACGDYVIVPQVLEKIARGQFSKSEQGTLLYRGSPAPEGIEHGT